MTVTLDPSYCKILTLKLLLQPLSKQAPSPFNHSPVPRSLVGPKKSLSFQVIVCCLMGIYM